MAASNFDESLRRLLVHEGGYSNHPSDPGGPTKYGITIHDYRRYVKPDATAADVQAMNVAHAKEIYRTKYWNALACDRLPAGLDYAVFDYGVNSGVARAAKVLRTLVGSASNRGVDQPTLAQAARHDAKHLIGALCDERLAFLKRLRTWPVFGRGWSRRVAQVRAAATAMADIRQTSADRPQLERADQAGSTRTNGKGVAPVNRAAQRGTSGAIVATGAAAAERAHATGAQIQLTVAILLAAIALSLCVWLFWRWRQRRTQMRVTLARNNLFPAALPEREQQIV